MTTEPALGVPRSLDRRDSMNVPAAQSMIDAIDALIVVVTTDGKLALWNRRCADASGVPLDEISGRSLWDVLRLRKSARQEAEEEFERLVSGEVSTIAFRSHWTRRDGHKARIAWTATVMQPIGRPLVLATGIEVTRGRRVAMQLEEVENRFEVLLDMLPEAFAVHQDGKVVFVNQAAVRLYGFGSKEAAIGADPFEFVAPSLRDAGRTRTANMVNNGSLIPISDWRHVRKDGTEFDVEVAAAPVFLDGRPAVEVLTRDISQRKAMEAEKAASDARMRSIFDESLMGMMLLDRDGRTLESNAQLRRLLGYEPEELARMTVLEYTHPEHRAVCAERLRSLFEGRIDSFKIDKICIAKDGSEVWVRVLTSPVRDAAGRTEYAVSMLEDIREHKLLEEQLRQASKMEALGRLAGGVAHDFNNLLTVVNGYSELLVDSLEGDQRLGDALEIRRAGARAAELTSQLLAFGRRGPQPLEPVELNLRVAAMVPMLRRLLGENIEFEVDFDRRVGSVEADPGQLDQVVMNLVVNARDAMPSGGVLRLRTSLLEDAPVVTPDELDPRTWARIEIVDSGVGIPPDVIDHIFEPFFTTKDVGRGTGLGLATVYGIVERMGGRVGVESFVGAGSRFVVDLPLTEVEPQPESGEPAHAQARGSETILLVEDEAAVRDFCKRALEIEGYVVAGCGPAEALTQAAALGAGLDMLVTDVVMPDPDGPALAELLRARFPGLPVLFMSGYPRDREQEIAESLAGGAVLTKPFSAHELCDAVRRILDGR